jgi:hypothetical protein
VSAITQSQQKTANFTTREFGTPATHTPRSTVSTQETANLFHVGSVHCHPLHKTTKEICLSRTCPPYSDDAGRLGAGRGDEFGSLESHFERLSASITPARLIHGAFMLDTTVFNRVSLFPARISWGEKIFATHVPPDELDGMAAVQELSA